MNKLAVFDWYDCDTTETINLAAKEYGLQIKAIEKTDCPDQIQVCLAGTDEKLTRFKEDLEDGDVAPFESKRDLSDEDYFDWLKIELKNLSIDFEPPVLEDAE